MSSTRLSAYCSKVIEAGWIAAIVLVPLYFNVYSSRVFEPDKLTLLRSIAVFMSAAWLIKAIEEVSQGASSRERVLRFSWRTPLVLPTLILVVVYLLSTLTSVARYTSLWGSYQRLQGTYTTLAYILVFFMILNEMRSREQLNRLITAAIITSIPISLYGLIQRYGIDPLPWGGDVTRRVASNMGNAIFISAYEIMVFFLTAGRVIESFIAILTDEDAQVADILRAAAYIFVALIQLITIVFSQSRGPLVGLLVGAFAFVLFGLLALRRASPDKDRTTGVDLGKALGGTLILPLAAVLLVGGITLLAGLVGAESLSFEVIALLGIVVAVAWFVTMLSMRHTWKWLWLSWVCLAVLAAGFLVAFNLPGTPLEALRDAPYIGRLGKVFQTESGTGKVRVLIWEGAVEMITPHEPLAYPVKDPAEPFKTDKLNFLRPLIGYGPESMYVAYNPFYPPDLAHYERRNASPDRSHNETFDALVITGGIGLVAYMFLFGSVFYYGLKWLGWVNDKRERNIWLACFLGGGVLGAAVLMLWQGVEFFGVGLPFGMTGGLVLYLILYTSFLYRPSDEVASAAISSREILLVALVSAILAHFVEIHFGIAIAATRTYFWVFAAVLVLLGTKRLALAAPEAASDAPQKPEEPVKSAHSGRRRRRRRPQRTRRSAGAALPGWLGPVLVAACVLTLIVGTLGFNFVTNSGRVAAEPSCDPQALRTLQPCWTGKAWEIIKHDLTMLPPNRNQGRPEESASLMTSSLLLLSLLIGGVVFTSESRFGREVLQARAQTWSRRMLPLVLDGALLLVLMLLLAFVPPLRDWLGQQGSNNWWWMTLLVMGTSTLLSVLVLLLIDRSQGQSARDWKRVSLVLELNVVVKLLLVLLLQFLGATQGANPQDWPWITLFLVGAAGYFSLLILDFVDWLQAPRLKFWLPELIVLIAGVIIMVALFGIADRHLQLGGMQRSVDQTNLVGLITGLLDVSMYLSAIVIAFYTFVFLFILVTGAVLLIGKRMPQRWATPWGALAVVPVVALALFIMNQTNIKVIRADVVYKQGEEWSRQQQWDIAIAHHKRALELAPDEDFYYLWAGSSYLEKSKTAPQSGCIITGDPNISGVLAMSIEQTAQLCQKDLLKSARTILLQAREVNPLNTDHTANLGRLYKNWADLDVENRAELINQSVGYYQQATRLSPQNTIVWNELATVYLYQLGDLEKAYETIQHSLELDDRYEQSYLIKGDMLLQEAEIARRELMNKRAELAALEEGQSDAALESQVEDLEVEWKHKLETALGTYERALEINPRLMNVYVTIANANEQMGRFEKAVEVLQEAALANPSSAEPYIGLAELYQRNGQPDAAVASYRQAIALKPQNANYHLALAGLLESLGRINEALVEVQESARLKPNDPSLRQNLAFMYQRIEMYPEALAEAQAAVQLGPNDVTSHLLVGDLARTVNDLETAAQAYEQALRIAPNLDNAWNVHLNLALVYQQLGRLDLALTHATAALETAPEAQRPGINEFVVQLERQN